jgi:hypothetical protein
MVEASRHHPARLDPSFSRDLLLMDLPLLISYANGNRKMCRPPGEQAYQQHKSQNVYLGWDGSRFDHLYLLPLSGMSRLYHQPI